MVTIYGEFNHDQFEEYKVKLHKELFWLLLYKDPKTASQYEYVDFDKYFDGLMRRINGLNTLLSYPVEIVSIMTLLEAAKAETKLDEFNYKVYRKLVLDAHGLIDKIGTHEEK